MQFMNRFFLLRSFFFFWFVAVCARLFYWQGIQAAQLQEAGRRQYERPIVKESVRGVIMSSDGYPLVLNTQVYTLIAKPNLIQGSPQMTGMAILNALRSVNASSSAYFGDPTLQSNVIAKLSDSKKKWVPLLPNLTEEQKKVVSSLQLPELEFDPTWKRLYPESSMSAQLLGFVGKDAKGNPKGYFGIEGEYDLELTGRESNSIKETDAVGHPIGLSATVDEESSDGRNLSLTLRRDIQFLIQKHLEEGVAKYGAKSGDVLIMEPSTGKIIAMASYPTYDPGNFTAADPNLFKNPIVADAYEPGSTLKVLTVATGIDTGVISPDSVCDRCSGPVTIGKYTIKTWDNKYHAGTTIQDGLTHSDNTAMVFVGSKVGKEKLLQYIENFGLGTKTGVDLQDESTPRLREKKDWGEIDTATATFGQGIALTPIQMLNIVNAIANGGKLMRPYVVNSVEGNGKVFQTEPQMIRQVISPQTARTVAQMMQTSASQGDAKWTLPKQYSIAGKTGTAQIPVAGHYDEARTIASFVGFSPVEKPQFSMLVRLVEPSTSQWGSETAAPLWFVIAKDLFVKYGISPNVGQ